MFHKGATAVAASKSGGYFVAVKREGIFHYSVESGWQQLFKLKHKIHAISYIGPYLFGVGENGTVIRSGDEGNTWALSSFAKMVLCVHMENIASMCQMISGFPGKL